jgi:hypothetical protein
MTFGRIGMTSAATGEFGEGAQCPCVRRRPGGRVPRALWVALIFARVSGLRLRPSCIRRSISWICDSLGLPSFARFLGIGLRHVHRRDGAGDQLRGEDALRTKQTHA